MLGQNLKHQIDVWIDEDLLLKGIRPHPILMNLSQPDTDSELVFWNLLREKLSSIVKVHTFKNLNEAGRFIIIPNPLQNYREAGMLHRVLRFKNEVLKSGRVPILTTGAFEYFPQKGEVVYSTSSYRDSLENNIIVTPGWLYDLKCKVFPISKPNQPTVGFVGTTRIQRRLNRLLNSQPIPNSVVNYVMSNSYINCSFDLRVRQPFSQRLRERVLNQAEKSSDLKTSFILRKSHYFLQTTEEKKQARNEYIQNIQNNAYTICVRGTENYSYRLYEVMSAGRIPIIIDTNMQLPDLGNFARWEEFAVIVPISKIHQIGNIVREFHNKLSDKEYKQICSKSRAAFEYLLPHNFVLRSLQHKLLR